MMHLHGHSSAFETPSLREHRMIFDNLETPQPAPQPGVEARNAPTEYARTNTRNRVQGNQKRLNSANGALSRINGLFDDNSETNQRILNSPEFQEGRKKLEDTIGRMPLDEEQKKGMMDTIDGLPPVLQRGAQILMPIFNLWMQGKAMWEKVTKGLNPQASTGVETPQKQMEGMRKNREEVRKVMNTARQTRSTTEPYTYEETAVKAARDRVEPRVKTLQGIVNQPTIEAGLKKEAEEFLKEAEGFQKELTAMQLRPSEGSRKQMENLEKEASALSAAVAAVERTGEGTAPNRTYRADVVATARTALASVEKQEKQATTLGSIPEFEKRLQAVRTTLQTNRGIITERYKDANVRPPTEEELKKSEAETKAKTETNAKQNAEQLMKARIDQMKQALEKNLIELPSSPIMNVNLAGIDVTLINGTLSINGRPVSFKINNNPSLVTGIRRQGEQMFINMGVAEAPMSTTEFSAAVLQLSQGQPVSRTAVTLMGPMQINLLRT